MDRKNMLSKRNWVTLLLFSFLGQIAWCIENSFLNLYMRRTVTSNPIALSIMVAASAVVATLTTIFVGLYSDKKGKRVPFMSYGYIVWGVTIMLFAVFKISTMQTLFGCDQKSAVIIACTGIIVMDCVMTLFGSTANDACFNAWVTDNTTTGNRGTVEAILSIMSMLAWAFVFVAFDGVTKSTYYDADGNKLDSALGAVRSEPGNWTLFFVVLGVAVSVIGIIGIFVNRDKPGLKPDNTLKFKDILYGFRPSVIKKNKFYYIVLLCSCIFGIAGQCYGAYLIIYFEYTVGVQNYIIPFGIIYGTSAIAGLIIGFVLDKKGKKNIYLLPAVAIYVVGSVMMYIFNPSIIANKTLLLVGFCVFALIQNVGNSIATITLSAALRDLTPKNRVGQFQGVRMVGNVMLPMCIGPMITAIFITSQGDKYVYGLDEFGEKAYTCPPIMFLLAGIVVLFALIPAIRILKCKPQELVAPDEECAPQ